MTYDEVIKTYSYSRIQNYNPCEQIILINESEYIHTEELKEYWWNISIKTTTKAPHNGPDLIIWNRETKIHTIVQFSCLLDKSLTTSQKITNYAS